MSQKITVVATKDPRAAYKRMAKEAHDARVARVANMVANGYTLDAANDAIDREIAKRRRITEAQRFCRENYRVAKASIGEIYAAKAKMGAMKEVR